MLKVRKTEEQDSVNNWKGVEMESPDLPSFIYDSRITLPEIVTFYCRSIRIGSYNAHAIGNSAFLTVMISEKSMSFQVPSIADGSDVVDIILEEWDFVRVYSHLSRKLPILFIQTTVACAIRIQQQLCMRESSYEYFDPLSEDETRKRITFLIDYEEPINYSKIVLETCMQMVFPGKRFIEEISSPLAHHILINSTPKSGTNQTSNSGHVPKKPSHCVVPVDVPSATTAKKTRPSCVQNHPSNPSPVNGWLDTQSFMPINSPSSVSLSLTEGDLLPSNQYHETKNHVKVEREDYEEVSSSCSSGFAKRLKLDPNTNIVEDESFIYYHGGEAEGEEILSDAPLPGVVKRFKLDPDANISESERFIYYQEDADPGTKYMYFIDSSGEENMSFV